MRHFILCIVSLIIFSDLFAVSFSAGSVFVDGSLTSKTVCYGANSGVISYSGYSVSGGFCEKIYEKWVDYERWEISYDGASFSTFAMPSGYNFSVTRTIWLRYSVAVSGLYATCGAWGFGYDKSGTTNTIKITCRPNQVAGTIGSNQSVCYGATPSRINSTALPRGSDGTFSYKWQQNTASGWQDITGQTATNYSPGALTAATSFRRAEVSSCATTYSNIVTVSVHPALTNPVAGTNQTICYNSAPTVLSSAAATGGSGGFDYLWQESTNNVTWSDKTGQSALTYTPPALTTSRYYRIRAISKAACGTVYSNAVTVTVRPVLVAGVVGNNQTIFYNTKPSPLNNLTYPTGGTGSYTYQWQRSTNNLLFTNIPGATNSSYSPDNLTQTTYYKRVETSGTCGNVTSNVVTITVYNDLNPGVIGFNQDICYGSTPEVLVGDLPTGGNGAYSYQWQVSTDGLNFSDAPSGRSQNYSCPALFQTRFYRRKVTCPPNTTEKYSNEIVIRVKQPLTAGAIGNPQTICYGSVPVTLVGNAATGGTESYVYQWYSSENNVNWLPVALANNDVYTPGLLYQDTYFRRDVTSGTCGTQSSNVVKISVLPDIDPGEIGAEQTICYNTQPTQLSGTNSSGGAGNYQYKWKMSTSGADFDYIPLATNSYYAPTNLTQTTYFMREVSSGLCGTKFTNPVTISVYNDVDPGQITIDKPIICFDSTPGLLTGTLATGGCDNISYQWQYSDNGLSWNAILLASGKDYIPSASLTADRYFKRIATSVQCGSKESNIISIDVLSRLLKPEIQLANSYCRGSNVQFSIKNKDAKLNYIWTMDGVESDFDSFSVINLQKTLRFSLFSDYDGVCQSPKADFTLTLDSVKANFSCDISGVSAGEPVKFENNSVNGASYLWIFDEDGVSRRENPWFYFNNPGLKTISLIAYSEGGCIDTSIRENYLVVGELTNQSLVSSDDIFIHPNPVDDVLYIELNLNDSKAKYVLTDQIGRVVSEGIITGLRSSIAFDGILSGLYTLSISHNNKVLTTKIIKK